MLEAAGRSRATRSAAARSLLDAPVPVERIPGFAEGLVSVQDAAAQHAARLLDLQHGQRVLDACAAPGGKTAHMLERADVELTALDHDAARLERVQSNLARLGLEARLIVRRRAPTRPRGGTVSRSSAYSPTCRARRRASCAAIPTSSGCAARRTSTQFAQRQREILDALWQLLARDGKLLYATCSVFHEENQVQIERFLERHRDARRLILPGPQTNRTTARGPDASGRQHDGFFYALLREGCTLP